MSEFILDFLTSFNIAFVLIFISLVMGFGLRFWTQKLDKKRGKRKLNPQEFRQVFLMVSLMMLAIIFPVSYQVYFNPTYFGYGRVSYFDHFVPKNDILWAHDYIVINGKNSFSKYCRLQVIDLQTGKRKLRKMLGEDIRLLEARQDTFWYVSKYEILALRFPSAEVLAKIDEAELLKIPELQMGLVAGYNEPKIKLNTQSLQIQTTNKSGYTYWINPFNREIKLKPKTANDNDLNYFRLKNQNEMLGKIKLNYELRNQLIDENGKIINEKLSFLQGKIIHTLENQQKLIILSYETTDRKEFILTCVNFMGKSEWQIKQKDLKAGDIFTWNYSPALDRSIIHQNNLVISLGGFVYSIRLNDGKINWQSRF